MQNIQNIFKQSLLTGCMLLGLTLPSCGDKTGTNGNDNFDRSAMLQNFADNIILPAFIDLQNEVNSLEAGINDFTAAPASVTLDAAQAAWDEAYAAWMYANSFNFGPAGESGIRKGFVEEIGTWPADITVIENNITANNTSLSDFNRDNRGFNAIDYLLFDPAGNDAAIINAFMASPNRAAYLQALIAKLKAQTAAVVTEWSSTYKNEFISNNGTDVGSSTSQLYNEFVRSFESIKNFKVGLPLGKRIGQSSTEPSKVEARYSALSRKYIDLHIQAIDDCWHGRRKTGTDGIGWKEYLLAVTGGPDLVSRTETQMAAIQNALAAIPETPAFETQINTNFDAWSNLHTQLQIQVPNYKSEMSSLLGIAITFSSGDGD